MHCNRTAAEQKKDEAEPSGDSLHYKATQNHSAFAGVVSGETWSTAGFDAGNSAWNLTERVGLHPLGHLGTLRYYLERVFFLVAPIFSASAANKSNETA